MGCFDPALWHESFIKVARKFKGDTERMRHCPNVFFADLSDHPDPVEMFMRRDNESTFVWPKNTLLFALHFLVWSGHKEIHFIGCDMGGEKDYWDDRKLTLEQRTSNRRLMSQQVAALQRLTPVAARNGVRFVSSTKESPLNAFMPYEPLEDAVARLNAKVQRRPVMHVRDADKHLDRQVVTVLKSGGDYKPEHVTRLCGMLKDCSVTLLTDLPDGPYPEGVKIIPLKHGWPGWFSKLELFSPEFGFHSSPFLFTDLDVTIGTLPDSFFTPKSSVVMAPYRNEEWARSCGNIQTNLMLLWPQERAAVWNRWREDPKRWMAEYRSDQEFVDSCGVSWATWQEVMPDAVVSYKQNIQPGLAYDGSELDCRKVKIVAYHGRPRPWECEA